jgi:hypothetical protein
MIAPPRDRLDREVVNTRANLDVSKVVIFGRKMTIKED